MPSRTIRFSENEDKEIKKFLENNPFLDFSTIARLAISKFIEQPEIRLKPNINDKETTKKRIH